MTSQRAQDLSDIRDTDIVVGVDGSPSARAALHWAAGQARLSGARLQAVSAWELPPLYGWGPPSAAEDLTTAVGRTLADSVREAFGFEEPDIEVLESVVPGHPAQVLLDLSARACLLVVGSRGHGGFAGTLLGSVSQHCVQHARCPVVVVRGKG